MAVPAQKMNVRERLSQGADKLQDLQALRSDLDTDVLNVEETVNDFAAHCEGGFGKELCEGLASSVRENGLNTDVLDIVDGINAELDEPAEGQDLAGIFEGPNGVRDVWEWENPEDGLKHFFFKIFGGAAVWLASKFPAESMVGKKLRGFVEQYSGIKTMKETLMRKIMNPVSVLKNLEQKIARAESVADQFGGTEMLKLSSGSIAAMLTFFQSNPDLAQEYADLETATARKAWWLQFFRDQPQFGINPRSEFTADITEVLTGERPWKDVMVDSALEKLERTTTPEVRNVAANDNEGKHLDEIDKTGWVPYTQSVLYQETNSILRDVTDQANNHSASLKIAGLMAVSKLPVGEMALAGGSKINLESLDALSSWKIKFAGISAASVFGVMKFMEHLNQKSLEETGDPVRVPDDPAQFADFIKGSVNELGNEEFQYLLHLPSQKINKIGAAFVDEGSELLEAMKDGVKFGMGAFVGASFEYLGDTDKDFLTEVNQQGLENLVSKIYSVLSDENRATRAECHDFITQSIEPKLSNLKQSEDITYGLLLDLLEADLQSVGLRLRKDKFGYIWLQQQLENGNWENVDRVLVDASEPEAIARASDLRFVQSETFAAGLEEGFVDRAELYVGNFTEFKEGIENGEASMIISAGYLIIAEPVSGAVQKIIPWHVGQYIWAMMSDQEDLSIAKAGATIGDTAFSFFILGTAKALLTMNSTAVFSRGGLLSLTAGSFGSVGSAILTPIQIMNKHNRDHLRGSLIAKLDLAQAELKHNAFMRSNVLKFAGENARTYQSLIQLKRARFHVQQMKLLRNTYLYDSRLASSAIEKLIDHHGVMAGNYLEKIGDKGGKKKYVGDGKIEKNLERIEKAIKKRYKKIGKLSDYKPSNFERSESSSSSNKNAAPAAVNDNAQRRFGRASKRARGKWGAAALTLGLTIPFGPKVIEKFQKPKGAPTEIPRTKITPERADELTKSLDTFGEPYNEVFGMIGSKATMRKFDNEVYLAKMNEFFGEGKSQLHEANMANLIQHVEAHKAEVFEFVKRQPNQTYDPGAFYRLKIKDGRLKLEHASYENMRNQVFNVVDQHRRYGEKEPTLVNLGSEIVQEFTPGLRTKQSLNRFRNNLDRGQVGGAIVNGSFLALDGVSDVLLAGGLAVSTTGFGAIVGVPAMAIGGGIRLATGGLRVLGKTPRLFKIVRKKFKIWNRRGELSAIKKLDPKLGKGTTQSILNATRASQMGATGVEVGNTLKLQFTGRPLSNVHYFN